IVIGVGQAAPALCARLDKEGLKTAVLERKLLGGTCVNNGCIPTKTLVASAHAAHVARRGGDYGFATGTVRVDMKAVKRRMDHVVGQSSSRLRKWIAGMKNVTLVRGQAIFTAPRRVVVKGRELAAEIGAIIKREGIHIRTDAECMALMKKGKRIAVTLECKHGKPIAEGTHALLAVGRTPNTADLGLREAGIEADERGYIKVEDDCRTSAEGVWALGECNGKGAFTHTSYNDYEIVAANLFDNDKRRISDRIQAYALFIDPPLGRAGMTEAEAKKAGKRALVGKMQMTRVGRAREAGETQGFMKVLVDAQSQELLGAAILGLNGDEIVHSLLDMMYAKRPYTTIQRAVHIHPTVTELIPTLLGDLKPLE